MAKLNRSEEWKEIKFPKGNLRNKYAISNKGRIMSYESTLEEGSVLKGSLTGRYPTLNIKPGGKDKTLYIHRLVAETFIENPLNKPQVNHIDNNGLNNNLVYQRNSDPTYVGFGNNDYIITMWKRLI